MTEIEFEKAVVELAHIFGWSVASFRQAGGKSGNYRTPVKYDGKGYVDLTMVHPSGCIVFAEMKALKGVLSTDQKKWGDVLRRASEAVYRHTESNGIRPMVAYYVWKPTDGNTIASVLSFGKVLQWTP